MTDMQMGLLSSCTIELLQEPLAAALEARGLAPSVWIGTLRNVETSTLLERQQSIYRCQSWCSSGQCSPQLQGLEFAGVEFTPSTYTSQGN